MSGWKYEGLRPPERVNRHYRRLLLPVLVAVSAILIAITVTVMIVLR